MSPRLSHQDCWELLPWHANGTLAPEEAAQVDEHLAACAICREEVRACRELALGLASAREPDAADDAGLDDEPEAGLVRVMTRLDDDEDAAAGALRRDRRLRRVGARALAATPRPVHWLIAAQSAALILLLVGVTLFSGRGDVGGDPDGDAGPATFRTLADPAPAAADTGGARVRVVFADDAPAAAVRDLLIAAGARVVDGPTPFGVYTVEPPAAAGSDASRLLARLRADPAVVFAEPALSAPPPARPAPQEAQ